jgi:predicted ATP-dependent endonuclease of OLD family
MKIKRVLVENFRSIKSLELFPSNICALVGENNAGKTNILAALDFLLGETYPSRRGLEKSDYYNQDTNCPIHIEVEFEDNSDNIDKVWCAIPWDGQGEVMVTYQPNSKEYRLSTNVREKCALVYLA